ncbi:MAG TPA: hypothetical protein VIH07_04415 [Candidatus Humimicrobiaceae bacterium]
MNFLELSNLRKNKIYLVFYIFLFLSFIFSSVIFFYYYKYQISPDTVEYIQIALKYSSGNFGEVVNGYRSPLFSILLVPFIKLGIDPLISTKILNIILGFILLIILRKTAILLKIEEKIRLLISFFLIPILMFCLFSYMTPDVLSAIFIILAFNLIIDDSLNYNKLKGIYFGIIAGFGFLTKAFNLYFLVFILTLICLIEFLVKKEKRKEILIIYSIAIGVTLLISIPWITLLSLKYHRLTFTTVGNWNYLLLGQDPQKIQEITNHLHPINSKSGFVLDDGLILASKFEKWFDLNFLIKNSFMNIKSTLRFLDKIYLTIFSLIFLIVYKRRDYLNSFKIYAFYILYIFGYSLLYYEDRFFYPLMFLGFLICISILLTFKNKLYKFFLYILILLIAYSFLNFSINYLKNTALSRPGLQYYIMGQEVQKLDIKGNIAASGSGRTVMYITYYNRENLRYFGTTKTIEELSEYDIDYYFIDKDDLEIIGQIGLDPGDFAGKVNNFYIYKLK